jgi:hypothetical protein
MASQNSSFRVRAAPSALAALAEHLRDGPLQQLMLLQQQTSTLANRLSDGSPGSVEDFEQLVRLSVLAMEHFNAFTREFAALLQELTNDHRSSH